MPRPTVSINTSAVATAINRELQQRGWKNIDLAREAGLSTTTVGFLVNGRDKPYEVDVLWKIAKTFDWEPEALLDLTDPDGVPTAKDRTVDLVAEHDRQLAALVTTVRRLEAMVDAVLARQEHLEAALGRDDPQGD